MFQYDAMYGIAFEGSEEPNVEFNADMTPTASMYAFFVWDQLYGFSGSLCSHSIISFAFDFSSLVEDEESWRW